MKKQAIIILLIMAACISAFLVLCLFNKSTAKNGFRRKVNQSKIEIMHVFKLPDRSFNFVSRSKNEITLFSYKHPLVLFKIDYALKELKADSLKTPSGFNVRSNYIRYNIMPPYVYLSNSEGDLATLGNGIITSYKIPLNNSDQSVAISASTIFFRSLEKKGQQRSIALAKIILSKNTRMEKKYHLPKHADGFFGNDGKLRYDKKHARLFYLYSYLGEFLCLDTNLNPIYRGKTIDTVNYAKIKLGVYNTRSINGKPAKKITQASPPNFINRSFTINKEEIYVLSGLKADNETTSFFNDNQPVDIYSIKDGKYLLSFYIPKYKNHQLRKLEIKDDILITFFDSYLMLFRLKK